MSTTRYLAAIVLLLSVAFASAEPAPGKQSAETLARLYIRAVVAQDWNACASILLPAALRQKQEEAVAQIKSLEPAEQASRLATLGAGSLKELEGLSPKEFYVKERTAFHQSLHENPEVRALQLTTLAIEILTMAAEEDGHFIHLLIRTHRDTPTARIHELMVVSVLQPEDEPKSWYITPDTLMPVFAPLEDAPKPAKAP